MGLIRNLLRDHRALTMLVVALALCVKAVVPPGYMLGGAAGGKTLTVQLCFGGIEHRSIELAVPPSGKDGSGKSGHDSMPDAHCPYTSLSMAADSGVDLPLLAIALAFIIATGFAPLSLVLPKRADHIRPPLRGPPSFS
ncbi:DUF2946 family protein [Novosphingobium sp. BW1]|uniref:DUF2946 family protein n=1 Tax=Novosphingobium sp. BW1 TaxID=2592621 RepID=UPI0011DEEDE0|nr:DUF2946 family protein [Novosphingobium sp. BW1]TYC79101.1 DUF2946 domain-containing protein [Novosphingobium sp. BW1]